MGRPVRRYVVLGQLHSEADVAALERCPVVRAVHGRDVEQREREVRLGVHVCRAKHLVPQTSGVIFY